MRYVGAQASSRPSCSSVRWTGSQPVSALAEPLSSSAARKAWRANGWSGPTQASHASGSIWPMPWTSLTWSVPSAVSYTHLTLPTIYSV